MSDRLALAVRTWQARRRSVCCVCERVILPGQVIVRVVDPGGWIHDGCIRLLARAATVVRVR